MLRTHTCGELRLNDENKKVNLCGWVHSIRYHGNVTFIDLRDRFGITQLVFDEKLKEQAEELKKEFVIKIEGQVHKKPEANKALETGEIEIAVNSFKIINKAQTLPLDKNVESNEETRLKYRYLDLRDPENMNKLVFRHHVAQATREFLHQNNYLEIETPLLVKSTPEGARDYLVPSRVNKGNFYALPQSPQLYKQILMIAGADKYYQFARCLRDEDLRADRQPEHTQIDLEMSFMDAQEIRNEVEKLMKHIFKKSLNIKLENFTTLTYAETMARFGSDKPDLRFGLELKEITAIAQKTDFSVFNSAEYITAIVVNKEFSRKEIDQLTEVAKTYKAKGLAYVKVGEQEFESGISKFLDLKTQQKLRAELDLKTNETVFFVADKKKIAQTAMGQIRLALRDKLKLVEENNFKMAWIVDFPLFSYNDEEQKWEPEHHMFSMPKEEFVDDFEKRPAEVLGDLWDLTLNGVEISSGSIRISNPEIQKRIMKFIGFDEKEAQEKFGFLLEAYKYGAPTHGGMGIGFDRLVALMLGFNDIREVVAFPKNKNAQCPMDGSPNKVSDAQLKELHINLCKS